MTNLANMNIAPGAHRRIPGPGIRKSRRKIERHWQLGLAVILATVTAASWRIARSTVT